MPSTSSSSYFLQEMTYPPYCIQPLKSWGMVAVGGGGGTAKTGVANAVDLKWIYLNQSSDSKNSKCSIQNVNSFSQHDSVMRMVSLRKQHEYLILALNRQLKVIMLKASQKDFDNGSVFSFSPPPTPIRTQDGATLLKTVCRRKSLTTADTVNILRRSPMIFNRNGQATVEAVGNETVNAITPLSRRTSFSFSLNSSPTMSITTIVNNIYTVPIQEHEYVNALVVCPATQSKLFVG
jgi:hypothetical protein